MVLSTVAFSAMHAMIVAITRDLHPFQVAFFRNVFAILMFTPLFWQSGLSFLRTDRIWMHVLRASLNVVAMLMFFTGLAMTPIARVTALSFTAPLFMALLSVIIFRERMVSARWIALIAGFAGTMIVMRPDVAAWDVGALLVLASALIWAFTMVTIKALSRTDSSITITGYMAILLTLLSFGPALWVWTWPTQEQFLWLAVIGATGTLAQLSLAEALKRADATAVMPFDFLKLVWASLLGFMIFDQVPALPTWIGGAVIFGAGLLVIYHESGRQRRQ